MRAVDLPVADLRPTAVDQTAVAPTPDPAATDPDRLLALDAVSVVRRLRRVHRPRRWSAPAFRSEVELIRTHLVPLRDRSSLASSFGREAFHVAPGTAMPIEHSAVRVAYALRWLELGDGTGSALPTWSQLLDGPRRHRLGAPLPA
jgi:hypothetical protein